MPGAPLTALQDAVLSWGEAAARDLPWRRTRDPWAVLVSELMLQQTQVARVVPRWQAFLDRFPTPAACARAPVGAVIRAWQGLGYNRRAVALHRAAQEVVVRHGGSLPADLDALLALPGIGPYTARAVLAFSFEVDVGLVETNTARVLARAVAGRTLGRAEAQGLADRLVPRGRAWAWNSTLMDLGATVCTKQVPVCRECPVVACCAWAATSHRLSDPSTRSAGVSRGQAPFAGSDRQGRGRLLDALRRGSVSLDELATAAGWPDQDTRARRTMAGLVADGLAREVDGVFVLP